MAHQFKMGQRRHARQRGIAMIMVISLVALMSSYFIASGLSRTQAEVNIEQDRRSLQALQQAKAALIANAASLAWTPTGSTDQPGALHCPSVDDAGTAGTGCSETASTRVGRFPWKTIGTSDLRDGSGAVLWYALSANFRKASGTTIINSDTQGTLTVTGSTPASNIIAVIIAPGPALNGQDRGVNSVSNYLESTNATGTDTFVTKSGADTFNNLTDREVIFNDRLVTITQAELMAIVEPAVAARIEQHIKPFLESYRSEWSDYPFPAIFSSATYTTGPGANGSTGTTRDQSNYVGDTTQSAGLLPIAAKTYSWTSGTVTKTGGIASTTVSGISCVTSSSNWRCDFTLNALDSVGTCVTTRYCMVNPSFRVTGGVGSNAGISFADLPSATSVTVTNTSGSTNRTMSSKTIAGTLTTAGVGTVNFDGTHTYSRYLSTPFTRVMRVTILPVVASSLTGSADANAGWFIRNEWFRQTYYAVSPGFLPGGGASCIAGTTCLTVNNLPSSYTTINDKRAILILAGRALTGSRPSSSLATYLEGENQSPADRIFTHRAGTASSAVTLNDRAIVLSP